MELLFYNQLKAGDRLAGGLIVAEVGHARYDNTAPVRGVHPDGRRETLLVRCTHRQEVVERGAEVPQVRDPHVLEADYHYGHGWEVVGNYDTRREALADQAVYRREQPTYGSRPISYRVVRAR